MNRVIAGVAAAPMIACAAAIPGGAMMMALHPPFAFATVHMIAPSPTSTTRSGATLNSASPTGRDAVSTT